MSQDPGSGWMVASGLGDELGANPSPGVPTAAGISSLVQKLRRDKRHANLIILESSPIETRIFPAAPMQHIPARNLSIGEKQAFSDLRLAVNIRPAMVGSPAPGADNGLSAFLASFAQVRAA